MTAKIILFPKPKWAKTERSAQDQYWADAWRYVCGTPENPQALPTPQYVRHYYVDRDPGVQRKQFVAYDEDKK